MIGNLYGSHRVEIGFKRCATLNCKGTKAMLERNKTDYECRTDTAWSNYMTMGMKVKSVYG